MSLTTTACYDNTCRANMMSYMHLWGWPQLYLTHLWWCWASVALCGWHLQCRHMIYYEYGWIQLEKCCLKLFLNEPIVDLFLNKRYFYVYFWPNIFVTSYDSCVFFFISSRILTDIMQRFFYFTFWRLLQYCSLAGRLFTYWFELKKNDILKHYTSSRICRRGPQDNLG